MLTSTCHCGAVELELDLPDLPDGLIDPRHCTCSICRRKGAIVSSIPIDKLRVVRGADKLTRYTFNTHTAQHWFCSVCGIYTHHQRRSNPAEYGLNIACIDGVDPFALADIPVRDGISHPTDRQKLR